MSDIELNHFENDGFIVIKKAILQSSLDMIHRDLLSLGMSFCQSVNLAIPVNCGIPEILSLIEDYDKKLFYDFCLNIGDLSSFNNISFSGQAGNLFNAILASYGVPLRATHSGLFFNKNKVSRLQYRWHQESSYFPKHDIGCHLWYPLVNHISFTGGPMLMKKGSHGRIFDYSLWAEDHGLTQLEIQNDQLTDYETVSCNVDLGDIVIFDHYLAHCTEPVLNNPVPRLSGIRRFVGVSEGVPEPCSTTLTDSKSTEIKAR